MLSFMTHSAGLIVVMVVSLWTVGKWVKTYTRNQWVIYGCSFVIGLVGFWLLHHYFIAPQIIQQCAEVGGINSPTGIIMGCK